MRYFEPVKGATDVKLPTRSTIGNAGYDFYAPQEIHVPAHGSSDFVWTNVKAFMESNVVLLLFPRSSLGLKGLQLAYTVGVVDSDYYGNQDNDGNIGVKFINWSDEDITLAAGERIFQGVFTKYWTTSDDRIVSHYLNYHYHFHMKLRK